jgi:hypothetical protein
VTRTAIEMRLWFGKVALLLVGLWIVVGVAVLGGAAQGAAVPTLNLVLLILNSYGDTADAKTYIEASGNFSFHESGVIGLLAGGHHKLMGDLNTMFGRLLTVLERSNEALISTASAYDGTDQRGAARVDATYPEVPRPAVKTD